MMRIVIIDDEKDAVYTLELIIQAHLPQLILAGKFMDPREALQAIPQLKPDLIFLDINMPGMSGFELLEKLPNKNFHIVFTTAYDEYALKAFKFNAVDYLLKPIDIDELIGTIKRIETRRTESYPNPFDIRKIIDEINLRKEEKITISTSDGIYFLKPSEILYLLASGSYTKVIRKEGDIIFVSKTLKELEPIVGQDFYRVHNSYIINLRYLKMLQKTDGWGLIMENGDKIPISRNKRSELIKITAQIHG